MAAQRRTEGRLEAVLLEVAWRADRVDGQARGRRELGRAERGEAWSHQGWEERRGKPSRGCFGASLEMGQLCGKKFKIKTTSYL